MAYSLFQKSNSSAQITDAGNTVTQRKQDEISIHFVGPSFSNRHVSSDGKHIFVGSMALSYLGYIDNSVFIN